MHLLADKKNSVDAYARKTGYLDARVAPYAATRFHPAAAALRTDRHYMLYRGPKR